MIVCSKCQMALRCTKNEVHMVVGYTQDRVGTRCQLVKSGDEYTCPGCGLKVITGFGRPFATDEQCATFLQESK